MKKNIILILALLFLLSFVGCKPTPSTSIISKDNGDEYIEDAKINSDEFAALKVPTQVSESINKNGNLLLNIEAKVTIPDADSYTTVQVESKKITEKEIQSLISFFTNNESESLYMEYLPSKDYWLQKISSAKKENITNQVYLDYINTQYANAKEEKVAVPLVFSELSSGVLYDAYIERKDGAVSICTFGKNYNDFSYKRNMDQEFMEKSISTSDDWAAPSDTDLTEQEAYSQAVTYLDYFDKSLELFSSEPCSVFTGAGIDSTGWSFMFTRNINGLRKTYKNDSLYLNPDSLPSYVAPWAQEVLNVIIDKDGLAFIRYQGGCVVREESEIHVKLSDFDSIKRKMIDQLYYIYGSHTNGQKKGLEITVSDFVLGIEMLAVKNENNLGQYVPTWRINYELKWQNDDEIFYETIFINAINGAYIEPRATTVDLMNLMND